MSKLLNDVRDVMRLRHYSYQTEKIYIHWIRQYIFFHNVTHPKEMGAATTFLVSATISIIAAVFLISGKTRKN